MFIEVMIVYIGYSDAVVELNTISQLILFLCQSFQELTLGSITSIMLQNFVNNNTSRAGGRWEKLLKWWKYNLLNILYMKIF